jgi:acetyl-CoA carboxylase biotin carboxyl carrier protein
VTQPPSALNEAALEAAAQTASRLIAAAPGPLRRVRLSAGDVRIELEWPEPARAEPNGHAQDAAIAPAAADAVGGTGAANGHPVTTADGPPLHFVCAPMVGTFYRSPEPGADPFVREGDSVAVGQQVAILEAMKMMMPVEADAAGQVVRILPADAAGVEYGEPLIAIVPRASA